MIVAAVIGLLAVIAIPNFVRARTRSQTNACINNLWHIDDASQEWALENHRDSTATVVFDNIEPYLKSAVTCPSAGNDANFGNCYSLSTVSNKPACLMVPETHVLLPDTRS